jgi:hypothetical protein
MSTNIGAYPNASPTSGFSVEAGYPTFDISSNESRATVCGWVPWDDLAAFATSIFPPSQIISGNLYQYLGQAFPGWPNLRCTNLKIIPVNAGDLIANVAPAISPVLDYTGTSIKLPVYNHAHVELTYENLKNQPVNDTDPVPYLTHRWSIGGEVITLGRGGSVWDKLLYKTETVPVLPSDPTYRNWVGRQVDEDTKAHVLIAQIEHEVTWPRVVRPPFTAIRNCIGHVNSSQLNFITGQVAVETLLFPGAQVQTQVMSDGTYAMEMVYRFSEKRVFAMDQDAPGGWNHFFYQGASNKVGTGPYAECIFAPAGFYRLERQVNNPFSDCNFAFGYNYDDLVIGYQDETAIYQKADFTKLFKPEP